jgi:hypothetical protein
MLHSCSLLLRRGATGMDLPRDKEEELTREQMYVERFGIKNIRSEVANDIYELVADVDTMS